MKNMKTASWRRWNEDKDEVQSIIKSSVFASVWLAVIGMRCAWYSVSRSRLGSPFWRDWIRKARNERRTRTSCGRSKIKNIHKRRTRKKKKILLYWPQVTKIRTHKVKSDFTVMLSRFWFWQWKLSEREWKRKKKAVKRFELMLGDRWWTWPEAADAKKKFKKRRWRKENHNAVTKFFAFKPNRWRATNQIFTNCWKWVMLQRWDRAVIKYWANCLQKCFLGYFWLRVFAMYQRCVWKQEIQSLETFLQNTKWRFA